MPPGNTDYILVDKSELAAMLQEAKRPTSTMSGNAGGKTNDVKNRIDERNARELKDALSKLTSTIEKSGKVKPQDIGGILEKHQAALSKQFSDLTSGLNNVVKRAADNAVKSVGKRDVPEVVKNVVKPSGQNGQDRKVAKAQNELVSQFQELAGSRGVGRVMGQLGSLSSVIGSLVSSATKLSGKLDRSSSSSSETVYRSSGGGTTKFKSVGTDTVPAMLTPGEFVVNAEQAKKYNSLLSALNENRFARGGPVKFMADGGCVDGGDIPMSSISMQQLSDAMANAIANGIQMTSFRPGGGSKDGGGSSDISNIGAMNAVQDAIRNIDEVTTGFAGILNGLTRVKGIMQFVASQAIGDTIKDAYSASVGLQHLTAANMKSADEAVKYRHGMSEMNTQMNKELGFSTAETMSATMAVTEMGVKSPKAMKKYVSATLKASRALGLSSSEAADAFLSINKNMRGGANNITRLVAGTKKISRETGLTAKSLLDIEKSMGEQIDLARDMGTLTISNRNQMLKSSAEASKRGLSEFNNDFLKTYTGGPDAYQEGVDKLGAPIMTRISRQILRDIHAKGGNMSMGDLMEGGLNSGPGKIQAQKSGLTAYKELRDSLQNNPKLSDNDRNFQISNSTGKGIRSMQGLDEVINQLTASSETSYEKAVRLDAAISQAQEFRKSGLSNAEIDAMAPRLSRDPLLVSLREIIDARESIPKSLASDPRASFLANFKEQYIHDLGTFAAPDEMGNKRSIIDAKMMALNKLNASILNLGGGAPATLSEIEAIDMGKSLKTDEKSVDASSEAAMANAIDANIIAMNKANGVILNLADVTLKAFDTQITSISTALGYATTALTAATSIWAVTSVTKGLAVGVKGALEKLALGTKGNYMAKSFKNLGQKMPFMSNTKDYMAKSFKNLGQKMPFLSKTKDFLGKSFHKRGDSKKSPLMIEYNGKDLKDLKPLTMADKYKDKALTNKVPMEETNRSIPKGPNARGFKGASFLKQLGVIAVSIAAIGATMWVMSKFMPDAAKIWEVSKSLVISVGAFAFMYAALAGIEKASDRFKRLNWKSLKGLAVTLGVITLVGIGIAGAMTAINFAWKGIDAGAMRDLSVKMGQAAPALIGISVATIGLSIAGSKLRGSVFRLGTGIVVSLGLLTATGVAMGAAMEAIAWAWSGLNVKELSELSDKIIASGSSLLMVAGATAILGVAGNILTGPQVVFAAAGITLGLASIAATGWGIGKTMKTVLSGWSDIGIGAMTDLEQKIKRAGVSMLIIGGAMAGLGAVGLFLIGPQVLLVGVGITVGLAAMAMTGAAIAKAIKKVEKSWSKLSVKSMTKLSNKLEAASGSLWDLSKSMLLLTVTGIVSSIGKALDFLKSGPITGLDRLAEFSKHFADNITKNIDVWKGIDENAVSGWSKKVKASASSLTSLSLSLVLMTGSGIVSSIGKVLDFMKSGPISSLNRLAAFSCEFVDAISNNITVWKGINVTEVDALSKKVKASASSLMYLTLSLGLMVGVGLILKVGELIEHSPADGLCKLGEFGKKLVPAIIENVTTWKDVDATKVDALSKKVKASASSLMYLTLSMGLMVVAGAIISAGNYIGVSAIKSLDEISTFGVKFSEAIKSNTKSWKSVKVKNIKNLSVKMSESSKALYDLSKHMAFATLGGIFTRIGSGLDRFDMGPNSGLAKVSKFGIDLSKSIKSLEAAWHPISAEGMRDLAIKVDSSNSSLYKLSLSYLGLTAAALWKRFENIALAIFGLSWKDSIDEIINFGVELAGKMIKLSNAWGENGINIEAITAIPKNVQKAVTTIREIGDAFGTMTPSFWGKIISIWENIAGLSWKDPIDKITDFGVELAARMIKLSNAWGKNGINVEAITAIPEYVKKSVSTIEEIGGAFETMTPSIFGKIKSVWENIAGLKWQEPINKITNFGITLSEKMLLLSNAWSDKDFINKALVVPAHIKTAVCVMNEINTALGTLKISSHGDKPINEMEELASFGIKLGNAMKETIESFSSITPQSIADLSKKLQLSGDAINTMQLARDGGRKKGLVENTIDTVASSAKRFASGVKTGAKTVASGAKSTWNYITGRGDDENHLKDIKPLSTTNDAVTAPGAGGVLSQSPVAGDATETMNGPSAALFRGSSGSDEQSGILNRLVDVASKQLAELQQIKTALSYRPVSPVNYVPNSIGSKNLNKPLNFGKTATPHDRLWDGVAGQPNLIAD